jgi:hypothetical protein
MKYLSLVIFGAALAWTWSLVHSSGPISFETHSGIQEKLAQLISDTIQTKRPNATEIVIQKIWTESLTVKGDKVRAAFEYSFKDNSGAAGLITSDIKGEGILERQPEDGSGNDRWVLTKVHTSSDSIQFDEAMIVTPGAETPETPESAPAAPANPAAPSKE